MYKLNQNRFRVVAGAESDTAWLLSWDDAPYVLEVLLADGWEAIWGLEENMSVDEAIEMVDDTVLEYLLEHNPELKA